MRGEEEKKTVELKHMKDSHVREFGESVGMELGRNSPKVLQD